MITWSGKGICVPIIFGGILYAYNLAFVNAPKLYVLETNGLPVALLATGVICFFLAAEWKRKEGKVYFDPKKNKEVTIRPNHSFYLLNVYYWSLILMALGLLIFFFRWY